ncbi:hypothetical protein QAD02_016290 [Eretmocerus hayati]|uniref:Uncharacterized protein n=1 Tax=Eretmocerus hayati TaxID=131215 RepID=A0ACC2PBN0_9HYME|nr:hypothetical protein QAD02_016290 [Eretmocerus hayati]
MQSAELSAQLPKLLMDSVVQQCTQSLSSRLPWGSSSHVLTPQQPAPELLIPTNQQELRKIKTEPGTEKNHPHLSAETITHNSLRETMQNLKKVTYLLFRSLVELINPIARSIVPQVCTWKMGSSETKSLVSLIRKSKYMQPALVRWQVSKKRSNEMHIHRISEDLVKVACGAECEVQIFGLDISQVHCTIQQNNGSGLWSLTNLSTDETYLNRKLLRLYENRLLKFGDDIQLSDDDVSTYSFQLVEREDGDCTSPPKIQHLDDDIGILINTEMGILSSHKHQMEELDVERLEHERKYDSLMAKSHDLKERHKMLTHQLQDTSEKLSSSCRSIDASKSMLQTIKADYENLYNSMKMQEELQTCEEEKLPSLKYVLIVNCVSNEQRGEEALNKNSNI